MGGDNKQIVKRKIVRSSKVVRKITPPSGGSSTPIKDAGNSGMKDKKSRNIAEVKLFGESSHEEGGYLADVSLNVSNMHEEKAKKSTPSREGSNSMELPPSELDQISITSKSSSLDTCLTEDYFSYPELGQLGYQTAADYEQAIEQCKEKILQLAPESTRREQLVKNLVDLRFKLENLKDEASDGDDGWKKVLNHNFRKVSNRTMKYYCDCCSALIWGILQMRYKCKDCGFNCHAKCLLSVRRCCVAVTAKSLSQVQLQICPEVGLANQQYCCAECKNSIAINGEGNDEARLCDYTGLFYCPNCHWNDVHVSPARILHNWDHVPRKVCRQSFQLLNKLHRKPILNVQEVNPMLFNFVEDLSFIQKMREDILRMKPYLTTCNTAVEMKLLRKLGKRQHFVDSANMYTIQDLKEVQNGVLLQELQKIHDEYTHHIKSQCSICQAKGFVCEVCNSGVTLFPFDPMISSCPKCHAVFHGDCFSCIDTLCPRCKRLHQRRQTKIAAANRKPSDDDDEPLIMTSRHHRHPNNNNHRSHTDKRRTKQQQVEYNRGRFPTLLSTTVGVETLSNFVQPPDSRVQSHNDKLSTKRRIPPLQDEANRFDDSKKSTHSPVTGNRSKGESKIPHVVNNVQVISNPFGNDVEDSNPFANDINDSNPFGNDIEGSNPVGVEKDITEHLNPRKDSNKRKDSNPFGGEEEVGNPFEDENTENVGENSGNYDDSKNPFLFDDDDDDLGYNDEKNPFV